MIKIIRKVVKVLLIILFILIGIILTVFLIYFFDEKDFCLDTSICKEGLEINTEYGLIKVNKENCIKYNWKWDDKSKYCNMRNNSK